MQSSGVGLGLADGPQDEKINVDDSKDEFACSLTSSINALIRFSASSFDLEGKSFLSDKYQDQREAEAKDFQEFKKLLIDVRNTIITSYKQVQSSEFKDNKKIKDYLINFSSKLKIVVDTLQDKKFDQENVKKSVDQLISAAHPGRNLLQASEPYISPLVGIMGAAIGFITGAVVGAVTGLGSGLVFAFTILGNMQFTPDPKSVLFLICICGVIGAGIGMVNGAIEKSSSMYKDAYEVSRQKLASPSVIENKMKLAVSSRFFRSGLQKNILRKKLSETDHVKKLNHDLLDIVASYCS